MPNSQKTDNWAGTIKALGLRAFSTGKFWQFGFLVIIVAFVLRIESSDWVKLADLCLKSHTFAWLGWALWVVTVVVCTVFVRISRARYLAEIERIVEHRNQLQDLISGQSFQSSKLTDEL